MVLETGESIPHLLQTARTLRQVRRMKQQFLLRWALERSRQLRLSGENSDYQTPDPIADATDNNPRGLFREDE